MSSGLGMDSILGSVAKDESSTQSQVALKDLFADVEFQASFPPISAAVSNNVSARYMLRRICKQSYAPIWEHFTHAHKFLNQVIKTSVIHIFLNELD